jgi:long-chain acyl-CoA synthetase
MARPHLVARTQENLWWEAENFWTSTQLDSTDVVLGVVPLSHAHGLGNALLAALRAGASLLLRPRFLRRQVLDLLANERVTLFPAVPFMLRMLAATDRRRRWDLSALRLCVSAGAPLPPDVFLAFRDRFGVSARQLYGLTEAGSVTCDLAAADQVDPTTVGRPLGNVVVSIADQTGHPLPPGEIGEIVVRSAAVEGGAARALHTLDLGRLDASGALTITGRTSLFINTAGNKVDPAEVEAALRAHPAVADVAVFGVAAAHDEQVVAAAVVLASDVSADTLRAHCRELLAPHKVPRVLTFRDALPRSPLGKVLIGRLLI